jgi:xanthine dehydrogenase YagR molybdenum-binding subunit
MTDNSIYTALVGKPLARVDGPLKVTGRAPYAYEYAKGGQPLYGYILGAAIGKGRITGIDTARAERAPGVVHVMTHRNAPAQPDFGGPTAPNVFQRARPFLSKPIVRYRDEPVALVVAETFEAARAAAKLIEVRYDREDAAFDFAANRRSAYDPKKINAGNESDSVIGDPDGAFASAPVKVEAVYENAYQSHNAMEPHATLAVWEGDRLTLYTSTQTLANIQDGMAATLQMPKEKVRVISRYIGGGFGSKLIPHAETVLAALAARELGRPVKVALTRQQMFANAGYRPKMRQEVKLGADSDGKLISLTQNVTISSSRFEEFAEQTAVFARSLYAAPNRGTRHRLVALDMNRGEWMRAPGEAPGMLAMETAMDELAEKLGLDPIELRIRNEPEADPELRVPFSTRGLVRCMREGAERFGWSRRNARPASVRDGRKLIGMGMSACIRPNYIGPTAARVRMNASGRVIAELDMTDIGTGTYTILTQVASEAMGVPPGMVEVRLGDTNFPRTAGSGGSWGAASSATALLNACNDLKAKLVEAARTHDASPLRGMSAENAEFSGGALQMGEGREPLAGLMSRIAPDGIIGEGSVSRGEAYKQFSQHAYGAHFAEVAVDIDTGEIRLRRMLSVFAAGRILNPKTARSQVIGGMVWGVGSALMEETVMDGRLGQFINHDLAEYHVATNADVPEVEAVFLDEYDDKANPFGSKGIGELGICGAGAAVGNAVYNATGVRVRSFPITLDKVLPRLPEI